MNAVDIAYIEITKARYLKDYQIEFEFNDETKTIIDFEPFLKQAKNPMLGKYLDLNHFKNFTVRDGDVDWNDYELCFPIADIYEAHL